MKRISPAIFQIVISTICSAQTFDTAYVDGSIYVKLFDTSTAHIDFLSPPLDTLIAKYGLDTMYWPFKGYNIPLDQTYRLDFTEISKTDSLIAELESLPMFEYAEKVPLGISDGFVPNDVNSNQTYLTKINAESAWGISQGSQQVTIAIIDNGVRLTHEDLAANIWVNPGEIPGNGMDDDNNGRRDDINGFDIADNDNNPNPPPGISNNSGFVHGTHCAGIASAVTDNGKGIASIGFKVKVMAVKVARNTGNDRELTHSYEGVFYAMRAGADIISMSFGGASGGQTAQSVINAAFNAGVVLIAAAGNEGVSAPSFPAAFANVISVGATGNNDQIASFSNFGSTIDVMAPGVSILSTLAGSDDSYGFLSGTSMACPLVAGLAGLILSADGNLSPSEVRNALTGGCDNINSVNPGLNGQIGAGRINAFETLSQVTGSTAISDPIDNGILIYPNPFEEVLHISMQSTMISDIIIFDHAGKKVFSSEISSRQVTLPLKELPSAVYFLQMTGGALLRSERIMKY